MSISGKQHYIYVCNDNAQFTPPARHGPCHVRQCEPSLETAWQSLNSSLSIVVAWRLVKMFRFSHMQQSTACLCSAWSTMSVRVGSQAARYSCLTGLGLGGSRQAGITVLSCLVWQCELSLPDKCVQRRSVSGGTGTASATAVYEKTVLSLLCLACRCELDHCSERVQTSNFLSVTVLSCLESNSHRQSRHNTDKTSFVVSGVAV